MQRLVKVDHKVRTDITYPAGFMDVISLDKISNGTFRLLYNTKGRFTLQRITPQEAKYKLCKVRKTQLGAKGIPYVVLHDGRTIRYPHPDIKVNDSVKLDLESGKIETFVKFEVGNLCMITGGHNLGRVGIITAREKHPGSFEIVHVKDAAGQSFATRIGNVFVIGKGTKSLVSLPAKKGIRRTPLEEMELAKKSKEPAAVVPTTEPKTV
jgi:small subunit ribosomal protein S4e